MRVVGVSGWMHWNNCEIQVVVVMERNRFCTFGRFLNLEMDETYFFYLERERELIHKAPRDSW